MCDVNVVVTRDGAASLQCLCCVRDLLHRYIWHRKRDLGWVHGKTGRNVQ